MKIATIQLDDRECNILKRFSNAISISENVILKKIISMNLKILDDKLWENIMGLSTGSKIEEEKDYPKNERTIEEMENLFWTLVCENGCFKENSLEDCTGCRADGICQSVIERKMKKEKTGEVKRK